MSSVTATTTPPPVAHQVAGAGTLDHDAFRAARYFPALDGLRAVAILLVFTTHLAYQDLWRYTGGGNGVNVFFVLSGFLITTLALREESRSGRVSLRSFYIRRLFRIYPIYLGVLAFYCVLIYGLHWEANRRAAFSEQLPYYLFGFPERGFFFLSGGSGAPGDAAWSIGIEEKFYLLWPFVGFVLLAGVLRRRLLTLAACAVLFALAPLVARNGAYLGPYLFIAVGCIAALLVHDPRGFRRLRALGAPAPLALGMLALLAMQVILGAGWIRGRGIEIVDAAVIVVALVGIVLSTGPVNGLLASRPMVFLGRISYVFYLTHNFAINAVERKLFGGADALSSLGDGAVSLVIAVIAAWIMHVTVEKPCIALGHRLAHREKPFHAV
jgi:peptidoglycan/LPS O-acetylase OafA/YrhL